MRMRQWLALMALAGLASVCRSAPNSVGTWEENGFRGHGFWRMAAEREGALELPVLPAYDLRLVGNQSSLNGVTDAQAAS